MGSEGDFEVVGKTNKIYTKDRSSDSRQLLSVELSSVDDLDSNWYFRNVAPRHKINPRRSRKEPNRKLLLL